MIKSVKDFIYSFFVKNFLTPHVFEPGEYIKDMAGVKYRVEGCFYTTKLEPTFIVANEVGELRSFPQSTIQPL